MIIKMIGIACFGSDQDTFEHANMLTKTRYKALLNLSANLNQIPSKGSPLALQALISCVVQLTLLSLRTTGLLTVVTTVPLYHERMNSSRCQGWFTTRWRYCNKLKQMLQL